MVLACAVPCCHVCAQRRVVMWPDRPYNILSIFSHKVHDFLRGGKKLLNVTRVLIFSTTLMCG